MPFEFIGPAKLYIGNPVTPDGANMIDLGDAEDVSFDPGVRVSFTSSAALSGAPKAGGIHFLCPTPVVQAQLKDGAIAQLQEILLNAVVTAATLGGGDSFQLIAEKDVPTLAIVPYLQDGSGVDAANAIWLPAAVPDQVNGFTFNRPQAGELGNPFNVQLMGAYREQDQGDADYEDPPGTPAAIAQVDIPSGNRTWFMGPPADLDLTWFLP